jgi:hypothetical protein
MPGPFALSNIGFSRKLNLPPACFVCRIFGQTTGSRFPENAFGGPMDARKRESVSSRADTFI